MRLDLDNSYLFHDIDKHGTIINGSKQMLVNDTTMLVRFQPDLEHIDAVIEKITGDPKFPTPYVKQCIVGKNGKHTGLFFTTFVNFEGEKIYSVEYEWWQNPNWEQNKNPAEDEVKAVKVFVTPNETPSFDVVVNKRNGVIGLNVNGETAAEPYNCIIDYSQALMWMGVANKLSQDLSVDFDHFACLYVGDISLLHVQETPLTNEEVNLFFNSFDKFLDLKIDVRNNKVYVTTDFSQTTPYKVRDFSGNGLHPLLFNHEWIG